MKSNKNYYVYEYIDPITDKPFYIGKGKGDRYLYHIRKAKNETKDIIYNPRKHYKIKKLLENENEPIIRLVENNLSEDSALKLEMKLIKKYGRLDNNTGILYNLTDGGDGQSGWVPDEEYKKRMSKSTSGEKNGMYGKTHSEETRDKIRRSRMGRKWTDDMKIKRSKRYQGKNNPFYGKEHTQETRKLISEKLKGKMEGRNNPSAKEFLFISPSGKETKSYGNFTQICKDNNLSVAKMKRYLNSGIIPEPKKNKNAMTEYSANCVGWEVKEILNE